MIPRIACQNRPWAVWSLLILFGVHSLTPLCFVRIQAFGASMYVQNSLFYHIDRGIRTTKTTSERQDTILKVFFQSKVIFFFRLYWGHVGITFNPSCRLCSGTFLHTMSSWRETIATTQNTPIMAEPFALLAASGFNESGQSKARATRPRGWSRPPKKEINRFTKIKE